MGRWSKKSRGFDAEGGGRFIVVGGVDVMLNGHERLTGDVDILLESSKGNIGRFLSTMSSYGEGFARELTGEDFTDEEGPIRIVEETERCQVDVFTRMTGLHYADLLQDAQTLPIGHHDGAVIWR